MEENKNNKTMITVAAIIVVAVIGLIFFSTQNKKDSQKPSLVTTSTPTTTKKSSEKTQKYKDGTYKTIGNYTSPGGPEELDVTITLKEGVIKDVEVISLAQRPNSVKFQGIFVANYEPFVMGKNIDEVALDKVSGSSLSPKGFNNAIEEIQDQAKS